MPEKNRAKGSSLASDICRNYRREGLFFDEILERAPVEVMKRNYMMFHTMAPELVIEDLKEIYAQKKN